MSRQVTSATRQSARGQQRYDVTVCAGERSGVVPQTQEAERLWVASLRCRERPAPAGLALAQDFLNTAAGASRGPDLLGRLPDAQWWAASAARAWTAARGIPHRSPTLTKHDARKLRQLRDRLGGLLAGAPDGPAYLPQGEARFNVPVGGEISWEPVNTGWRWFAAAIWGEVLIAQQTDTWQRLKKCPDTRCGIVFYDRSWDNSAVWHNRMVCGPRAQRPHSSVRS